jgi:maleylpyruvate isomerase
MKLYTYYRSSAAYRARIALNYKGLAYESVPIDLRAPVSAQRSSAYLAFNPEGLVPVLVDGELVVRQSLALIEYLEETHPLPPLLPRGAPARARVRALTYAIACDIHPLNNTRVLSYLRGPLGQAEGDIDAWYAHWIARGFAALEAQVGADSDGSHMFGDTVTLADVCVVPQMYNARRMRCELAPYPKLCAICAHLETLPAFAAAAPERQPDAPPA